MQRIVKIYKDMFAEVAIDGPDDLLEFCAHVAKLNDGGELENLGNQQGWVTPKITTWDVMD